MALAAPAVLRKPLMALGQSRLITVFKIKELRQKIFITILFLAIYRIGFHVPLPIIDQQKMFAQMRGSDEGLLGLISMFSGGSLSQSTIFALGIYGLGSKAKMASSFIVMGITGGAMMPKVMGWVGDHYDMSKGFIVPLFCFAIITLLSFSWPLLSGADSLTGVSASKGH